MKQVRPTVVILRAGHVLEHGLKQHWKAVMAWVMVDPAQPLENQFFQGLCLLGGALTLFVVIPANLLQHMNPWVNRWLIPLALGLLGLAWAARRGHYHRRTALFLIIAGLDLVWFPNGGSQGSIGLYFFTPALFLVVVFKGGARIVGFFILVGNIVGMHLAESAWPNLAQSFTPMDRLIDLSLGYFLSMLVCSLMLWVVLTGFYREKERITESERLYRDLLNSQGEGFALVGTDLSFRVVNPVAEEIFGLAPGQLIGRSLLEFVPSEHHGEVQRLSAFHAKGAHSTYELEILREDGAQRTLLVTATPRPSEGGGPLQTIGVFRDISERKEVGKMNRLLAQEKHQTQKMDSLGSLAGGVAHDFNNMLAGIMGYAELMLTEEADPKRQKYLRSILNAASRSAELTKKLLAFGRRGKNIVEAVDLRCMVEECLSMLRPSMNPNVQVVVAMEECPTVDGDPSQIHQVLMNLLLNAMEAMPEFGTLTITSNARELDGSSSSEPSNMTGTYAELFVSDTGMGMTEDIRQRVFEPFFTTKNTPGTSGTGLGLSTAYGIIHAHRGAISVASTLGKGSSFRVLLPKGTLTPHKGKAPTAPALGNGVVLLVEDEPILMDMGKTILESLGYEVVAAADGVEAVEAYREHHTRLSAILLDLKMPRMDGREAFLEIQKISPAVPVIVCTGYGENEEVQDLLSIGAAGMLAKPYQVAALGAKLRQVKEG